MSGASAALPAGLSVTGANGETSVTATANGTGGSYAVTAADARIDTATFNLTNTTAAVITSIVTTTGLSAGTAVGFEDSTFTVVIAGTGFEQGRR